MALKTLLPRIRYLILSFSFILSLSAFMVIYFSNATFDLRIIKLTRFFAFASTIYLYIALLVSPLYAAWPQLPLRGLAVKARRAVGVSAFFFALLHASFAFFGQLGGFEGLFFLSSKYLIAISLSFMALLILALMASTSFDKMVNRLGQNWKMLHRLVYLAALYILIHALMLGSHFSDLNSPIPQITLIALAILLLLESLRFDKYLSSRITLPKIGISQLVVLGLIAFSYFYLLLPKTGTTSLSIHAQHQNLAQENLGGKSSGTIAALTGDKTKRYSVQLQTDGDLTPGSDIKLKFQIRDAATGSPVTFFSLNMEKLAHLIIVDEPLQYFDHLHPEQNGSEFSLNTKFPKAGFYRLYLDFQPVGAIEQQFASRIQIGEVSPLSGSPPDDQTSKKFGDYDVSLSTNGPLNADQLTLGTQAIKFTIKKSGQPVTNLQPYLGAFGHMVLIRAENYEYYHVHPTNLQPIKPEMRGGPEVSFNPVGIYGPIKPGMYRIFVQLNPDGKLFTADFTVRVD